MISVTATPDIVLLVKVLLKPSKLLIATDRLLLKDECGLEDSIKMF